MEGSSGPFPAFTSCCRPSLPLRGKDVLLYPCKGNHPSQGQFMTTLLLQGMVSPLACVAHGCGPVPASAASVLLMFRCYHRKAGYEELLEVPSPMSCSEQLSFASSLETVNHGFALPPPEDLIQRCTVPSLGLREWHWLPLSTSTLIRGAKPTREVFLLLQSWLSPG